MNPVRDMAFAGMMVLLAAIPAAAEAPTLRIAVLKFGTVEWLMRTISAEKLDRAEGFTLETLPLAGGPAAAIAFQSGEVDLRVTDCVWALNRRAAGVDIRFAPYSRALGALMTRGDVADLCALKGRAVGVVGGALDKSWLVLQALARKRCGFDLAAETETLFGAPPLMNRQLEAGTVDAVATYWPYVARLKGAGMVELTGVAEAMVALGAAPAPPLVGFVWDGARAERGLIARFLSAVAAAGEILAGDDAAWERLRPLMQAKDEAAFLALRDAYRAGIVAAWTDTDTSAARRLYAILTAQGGDAFLATAGPFDPAVFPPYEGE